jgi:hypothetical protein
VDMNISFLSFIDIYSGGGIKVITGRFYERKCISTAKLYSGTHQKEKGMSGFSLPFFFLNMVWLLQGFRG